MTTTNIKDVLHLYLGCECLFTGERVWIKHNNPVYHTLVGVELDCVNMSSNGVKLHYAHGQHKPILRPLSDLTEAEQEQWNKISTPIGEMAIESAMQIHWAKRLNFYRSIGIDCDQLLESGQAINRTTLKR